MEANRLLQSRISSKSRTGGTHFHTPCTIPEGHVGDADGGERAGGREDEEHDREDREEVVDLATEGGGACAGILRKRMGPSGPWVGTE